MRTVVVAAVLTLTATPRRWWGVGRTNDPEDL
jgi:hypothetical protein